VNPGVIESVFAKQSPIHDGAVVIHGNRITQVGTFLPLTQKEGLPSDYGTRHRAALGLSEVSDAAVLVVSEERGEVSLVQSGKIKVMKSTRQLEKTLERVLHGTQLKDEPSSKRSWLAHAAGLLITCLLVATVWGLYTGGELSLINMTVPIDFRNMPENLELKEVSVERIEIQISGRQQLVNALQSDQVRAFLDLEAAKPGIHSVGLNENNIEIPLGLEAVRVSPSSITLELEERVQKSVPVEPKTAGIPPAGYQIEMISVVPQSVELVGRKSELNDVGSVFTEEVDLSEVDPSDGETIVKVPLVLSPASLRLASGQPREVQVRIRFEAHKLVPDQPQRVVRPYHVVRAGETLWELSRRYGLSVDRLRQLNDLAPDAPIYPGQQLKLSAVVR
jgi:LysM repeat protein